MVFYSTIRRDCYHIWIAHVHPFLGDCFSNLIGGETIELALRTKGDPKTQKITRWVRMNDAKDGRPTLAIRIIEGISFLQSIRMGEEFEIALIGQNSRNFSQSLKKHVSASASQTRNEKYPILASPSGSLSLFQAYLSTDYSGSSEERNQRLTIKVAIDAGNGIEIISGPFNRHKLVLEIIKQLDKFTRMGVRLLIGLDHQYGIPLSLVNELGLGGLSWREILTKLYSGAYGPKSNGPKWGHPSLFAADFNAFLLAQGKPDYFWTKSKNINYVLRSNKNPRISSNPLDIFRLTDICNGNRRSASLKPFSRVGGKGSVSNQTCCGMGHLLEILQTCEQKNIPVAVWPMDGLDITSKSYKGKHCFIELNLKKQARSIFKSYENNATESVRFIRDTDQRGELASICDLSSLTSEERKRVQIEGWIFSHSPSNRRKTV